MVQGRSRCMAPRRRRRSRPDTRGFQLWIALPPDRELEPRRKHLPGAAGHSPDRTGVRIARQAWRGVELASSAIPDELPGPTPERRRSPGAISRRPITAFAGLHSVAEASRFPSPCRQANSRCSSRRTRRSASMPKPTPNSFSGRPQGIRTNSLSEITRCTRVRHRSKPANGRSPK